MLGRPGRISEETVGRAVRFLGRVSLIKAKNKGPGWQSKACNITDSMDMDLSKLREVVMDGETWRAVVHGVGKSQTRLSD